MSPNNNLKVAKNVEYDEFYTQLVDIENELQHYESQFEGKVVYCNCDDPTVSNFFRYFISNFSRLGLKRLITTCYKSEDRDLFSRHDKERAIMLEYDGFWEGDGLPKAEDIGIKKLEGDGDFRNDECIEILKRADIVVTNPPFSLFREFVNQMQEFGKHFLIIGNQNAISYKQIFSLMKDNKLWLGINPGGQDMYFDIPKEHIKDLVETKEEGSAYIVVDGVIKRRLGNAMWFTNLENSKRISELPLEQKYEREAYPHYDNYDAIEVNRVKKIPKDWSGPMGVPITFFDKYNPEQFEIIGLSASAGYDPNIIGLPLLKEGDARASVNGKTKYARIFIRNRNPELEDDDTSAGQASKYTTELHLEGFKRSITITTHERNPNNRKAAILEHGVKCFGCNREMKEIYGDIAEGYIHIHHCQPLSSFDPSEKPDIKNLVPLCPNCHAVVHLEEPPISVDRLKELISKAGDI